MGCEQFAQNEDFCQEDLFFDSKEEISSVFDSCPSGPSRPESNQALIYPNWVSDVWAQNPSTIQQRREKFTKLIGLDLNRNSNNEIKIEIEIERESNERDSSVSPSSPFPSPSSSSSSSDSSSSDLSSSISEENLQCRIKNLDTGTTFVPAEFGTDGTLTILTEIGSNKRLSLSEFEKTFSSSSFTKSLMNKQQQQESNPNPNPNPKNKLNQKNLKKNRVGWLKRLGINACIMNTPKTEESKTEDSETEEIPTPSSSKSNQTTSFQSRSPRTFRKVKVKVNKKKSKELSSLFEGQIVKAHDGAILAVKFSPDGKYLATGGEDGIIKIWKIHSTGDDINDITGDDINDEKECWFRVDGNCELVPVSLGIEENKGKKGKKGKESSNRVCVVVPKSVFRVCEEPVCEFLGHEGEILDLDWSNDLRIISSSTDKTVRLWQMGREDCIRVFQHKNYVTCVQFDPKNEDNFISGSIDGKIRVWAMKSCHVSDWTDVREIVTAVCYRPDGNEVVVGTITGNCRFYDASGKNLQLENEVSLNGKKKSPLKRITGFQFCPNDAKKLMVTSADSKIKILDGIEIISKFKGLKSGSTTPVPARFTSDGRHVIVSDEDSTVYLFNHSNPDPLTRLKPTSSHERFSSQNSSIAVPWTNPISPPHHHRQEGNKIEYVSPSGSFSLSEDFLAARGSATWPEEKLPGGGMSRSQFRVLRGACSRSESEHMWGQVVVTAGWDGVIRVFQNYGLPVGL
ncbi:hypothetical protein LUZ60_016428 [Juncus effusus]|nr:hypothetical protein LUZ60_016428 [Juncus effusus]